MQAHAAECSVIFDTHLDGSAARATDAWLRLAGASLDPVVAFSYACFCGWRASELDSWAERQSLVHDVINRIRAIVPRGTYRQMAFENPELRRLGGEPGMRDAVLAPITSTWEIARFSAVRDRLERFGVRDPAEIAVDDRLGGRVESLGLGADEFGLLIDASWILRAAQETAGELSPTERLRASRYLIDTGMYGPKSLAAALVNRVVDLIPAVAGAVYWMPTDTEVQTVQRFVHRLAADLSGDVLAPTVELPRKSSAASRWW